MVILTSTTIWFKDYPNIQDHKDLMFILYNEVWKILAKQMIH